MHKLCFYVPTSHLEVVKSAVFSTGAGQYGSYDQCCWQTLGQAQFRPLEGSQPYIGKAHQFETVEEYKVEMLCEDALIPEAVRALISAHPYEEPAYDFWHIHIKI
ncbi:NGG1p interacting factor NIF3 [Endozoicomonas sp. (ex Bugula neritina AB1)]|nr:NGG1p interacting factor NIF3 [Endozoicomonas sp. (ex Bugula neritina AB1)]